MVKNRGPHPDLKLLQIDRERTFHQAITIIIIIIIIIIIFVMSDKKQICGIVD